MALYQRKKSVEIKTSKPFGPLFSARLLEFERKCGVPLPADYREFLLEHNGGQPDTKNVVDFEHQGKPNSSDVHFFYGIHEGENWASIEWYLETGKGRLIEEGLPIAGDSGGNDYVLIVDGKRKGQIYFWDHERETTPPSYENMSYVAPSFTAFCESLHEYAPPGELDVERIVRENDVRALTKLLDSGYDIEQVDHDGYTVMEKAAMRNRPDIIRLLFQRGAQLRKALQLAEGYSRYFPEHKVSVDLLRTLHAERGG
jgi:hypothetical protein